MDSQSNFERRDHILIDIERELNDCPSGLPIDCHIFRVDHSLRKVNEEAYEPKLVAIGPYHRGNAKLQGMEVYKKWYLKRLLHRRGEPNADRYIIALKKKEVEARKFYADQESFSLDTDEFVKMLLLDGCFIIELFRQFDKLREDQTNDAHSIVQKFVMRRNLRRDLWLLENQLPFFVLVELFEMTTLPNSEPPITVLAKSFLLQNTGLINYYTEGNIAVNHIKHLLELVHDIFCSLFDRKVWQEQDQNRANVNLEKLLNCAVELEEAGIEFKKFDAASSFFDIQFNKGGVMKIPSLLLDDDTETLLRNLVAYEQYRHDKYPRYVSDYTYFLSRLINSTKDVQLLRRKGIIQNYLGSDAAVCNILNKLGDEIVLSADLSHYSPVFRSLNEHCERRWNLWMAKLRWHHLSSPWAIISVLAASILLLLTLAQTAYTILAYYN